MKGAQNNASLPIRLYIYGGGFVGGNSIGIGPDLFVNRDVILATINYRVGIFGFISTQDEVIPGNNGLKDQRLAIQWTHDNIHLFGGNPDKVKIFGESAGAASVAYQLLNQDDKGLFHGAILQSGTFLSPWTFQRRAREIAFATASFLNSTFKTSNDSQALLTFLLAAEARVLDDAAGKYRAAGDGVQYLEISHGFYWTPVAEVENPDAFLTKQMYGLLESGKILTVPILIGINSEENLSFNSDENYLRNKLAAFDEHLDWVVPHDMQISDNDKRVKMGRKIRQLYTGGEPWVEHLGDGVRYSSDTSFTRSVIKHAELYSKFGKAYFYVLSYDGDIYIMDIRTIKVLKMSPNSNGCDDSRYPESDRITRKRIMHLWTDFAKYQNPTPEPTELKQNITWPPVSTDKGDFCY